jgi:hypothetical protein
MGCMLLAIPMLVASSATHPFIQGQFDRELNGKPWSALMEITRASDADGSSNGESSYSALPRFFRIQFTWCDAKHWALTVPDASAPSFARRIIRSGSLVLVGDTAWDAEFLSEWSRSRRIQAAQKDFSKSIIPFEIVSEVFFPLSLGMRQTPEAWAHSYVVREVAGGNEDLYRLQIGVSNDPFRNMRVTLPEGLGRADSHVESQVSESFTPTGAIEFDVARQAIAEWTTNLDGQDIRRVTWTYDTNGTVERVSYEQSRNKRLEKVWEARVLERKQMSHEECNDVIPEEQTLRLLPNRHEWQWSEKRKRAPWLKQKLEDAQEALAQAWERLRRGGDLDPPF